MTTTPPAPAPALVLLSDDDRTLTVIYAGGYWRSSRPLTGWTRQAIEQAVYDVSRRLAPPVPGRTWSMSCPMPRGRLILAVLACSAIPMARPGLKVSSHRLRASYGRWSVRVDLR